MFERERSVFSSFPRRTVFSFFYSLIGEMTSIYNVFLNNKVVVGVVIHGLSLGSEGKNVPFLFRGVMGHSHNS